MNNREWEDYYNPVDFLGAADIEAREYLKNHPDADKKAVKQAAEDFALAYEYSDSLRQKSFKNQLLIAMKTADYNNRKNRKEREEMDKELKQAIIRDYQTGMTAPEIAERYGLHPTTTVNNIRNWAKSGLLELRTSTRRKKEEIAGDCKEKTPTVEFYESGFPVDYETPEPPEEEEKTEPEEEPEEEPEPIEDDGADFLATLERLEEFVCEVFPGSYVLECFASNVKNFAGIQFVDGTGRAYLLKLEEKTEEDRDDF